MLQTIRERAQGWFAWAIVILITIPFAFWGIESYLGGGSEPAVATVNGQDITERELEIQLQNYRSQLRERLGAAYRPEMFDDAKLRQDVLDNLVRELVLAQATAHLGLAASKGEIRNAILAEPGFQRGGQFDMATYERAVQLQGLSPRKFEERLRQRLISTQLSRLVAASELITDAELAETVRLLRQQRSLSYVTLPAARFVTDHPIADADVAAYYEAHPDNYRTPEQVRVAYLVLDAQSIGSTTAVGEEELRAFYDKEAERFGQPERRSVRHILIQLPAGADEAAQQAARQRSEQILARLRQGEDFSTLATEFSEDPGSAAQGGDLGLIERGMMDPAFERAAYALEAGVLSDPVQTAFGYHILRVDQIVLEQMKPFAEVRDELLAEVQKKHVEGLYFELAERLANLTYEHPDSLEPAAQALGLKVQESGWLSRSGGQGVLANPKVMAAAFAPDVLQGSNTELIEPERDAMQAIVLRVLEHQEASMRSLAEVRPEIEAAMRNERARTAAQAAAAALLPRLRGGTPLSEVAGDYPVTDLGLVGRDDPKVPAPIRNLAFTLARPSPAATSFGETTLANGDAVVVQVGEVQDGTLEPLTPEAKEQERQRLARTLGRQSYEHLVSDLVSRAKVTRRAVARASETP